MEREKIKELGVHGKYCVIENPAEAVCTLYTPS